jgi:hypothetical protein
MPFTYRIDPSARLAAVAFFGEVTGRDLVEAIETLFSDEAWEPGFQAVWDGRGLHSIRVSYADYGAVLAAAVRVLPRIGGGTGVILTSDPEEYEAAFMIRKFLGPVPGKQVRLADNLREALALLGIPALPAELEAMLNKHLPVEGG